MSNISVEGSLPLQRTGSEICPITLDRIDGMNLSDVETTPCGHRFNREALQGWVSRGNLSCPLCRQQLNISSSTFNDLQILNLRDTIDPNNFNTILPLTENPNIDSVVLDAVANTILPLTEINLDSVVTRF